MAVKQIKKTGMVLLGLFRLDDPEPQLVKGAITGVDDSSDTASARAEKRLLQAGGFSGVLTVIFVVSGFLVGDRGASLSGELVGTFQTYGEPLGVFLSNLIQGTTPNIIGRILLFVASPLAILFFLALYQSVRRSSFGYSLLGTVTGILAATSFAIPLLAQGPVSLAIADVYSRAAAADKGTVVTVAQAIDQSIGLTVANNVFLTAGLVLLMITFLAIGLAMMKNASFGRGLGWMSIIFSVISILIFTGGSLVDRHGIAILPTTMFAMIWFFLIGSKVYGISRPNREHPGGR